MDDGFLFEGEDELDGTRLMLTTAADDCVPRQMVLRESSWRPEGEADTIPTRTISRSGPARAPRLPDAKPATGSWPSFRGTNASGVADGQDLPEKWDAKTNESILWRTPIPGLAHSSPVVWGDRIFVTSAISSRGNATFKPGLYGDGDASDDRSSHKWMLYVHAYDVSGNPLWRVDLGRVDMGAYNIPSYEWGPASSPIIWKDMVFIQCRVGLTLIQLVV